MELKELTVRKVQPKNLPQRLCFKLFSQQCMDLNQFVLVYDNKEQILYVNESVSDKSVDIFVECATYEEPGINDLDGPMEAKTDYIYQTYGSTAFVNLMEAYTSRQKIKRAIKAREKAKEFLPLIAEANISDDISNVFDEELIYEVHSAGMELKHRTAQNLIGYGSKYVFWLGYLIGTGEIKMEDCE